MKKTAILVALAVIMPMLLGAAGKGCSPGGQPVTQVPASANGECDTNLAVSHKLGRVIGTMEFICRGEVVHVAC